MKYRNCVFLGVRWTVGKLASSSDLVVAREGVGRLREMDEGGNPFVGQKLCSWIRKVRGVQLCCWTVSQ